MHVINALSHIRIGGNQGAIKIEGKSKEVTEVVVAAGSTQDEFKLSHLLFFFLCSIWSQHNDFKVKRTQCFVQKSIFILHFPTFDERPLSAGPATEV